jgi:hypothetical protein
LNGERNGDSASKGGSESSFFFSREKRAPRERLRSPHDFVRLAHKLNSPFSKTQIMNDINDTLKEAYNATSVIVMPGSGSYGMESVARQWATGKKVMVLRNGYFSYRWTDIFEQTQ